MLSGTPTRKQWLIDRIAEIADKSLLYELTEDDKLWLKSYGAELALIVAKEKEHIG